MVRDVTERQADVGITDFAMSKSLRFILNEMGNKGF